MSNTKTEVSFLFGIQFGIGIWLSVILIIDLTKLKWERFQKLWSVV
ncbi:unnamed protein product [Callosobruchus maculatus]|uniref:Uncharacterized protein n=1 Tax=Callosobruchus maculatus TaxID=64391 RepID=A0A653BQ70_CALMS|nr:unnamed protein product [Callosobruchus maculatus]